MENVFRNQLVSKNQYLRGNVLANPLPRNTYMSQYHVFAAWQRAGLVLFVFVERTLYRVFSAQADWTLTHTSHKDTEQSTMEAFITLDGVKLTH
jgi:hypothetical protein